MNRITSDANFDKVMQIVAKADKKEMDKTLAKQRKARSKKKAK